MKKEGGNRGKPNKLWRDMNTITLFLRSIIYQIVLSLNISVRFFFTDIAKQGWGYKPLHFYPWEVSLPIIVFVTTK